MTTTQSQALINAETQSFSHDISHCNPDNKHNACYECLRYAAHLQLQIYQEKFYDGLYSYLSEPQASCLDKDHKMFVPL